MPKWIGKRLLIDLDRKLIIKEEIDEKEHRKFLGGRGINVSTLLRMVPKGIDAFDPRNVLCFGAGLFTGTTVPSSARFNVSAKSPATGMLGDANSGGFWAPELKFAGYDQVVIVGKSKKPVFIKIYNDEVSLEDASHLWGKNVWETEQILKKILCDDTIQIASIGQAGENRVRIAGIINNLARAAARTGMGAVMGSKNLKAIVVKGTKGVKIFDPRRLTELNEKLLDFMYQSPSFTVRSTFGTSFLVELYQGLGVLTTRNSKEGQFEGAEKISGRNFLENYAVKSKACFNCPVHCGHYFRVKEGKLAGTEGEGVEFETMAALGSKCGNDDLESILLANNLCNQYGLDTISVGGVISFAMECYENGLLSSNDCDGLELKWGDSNIIIQLIHLIGRNQGIGSLLGEGVARASKKISGSGRFALHVKGLETPEQEIRGLKAWGLGWAVSSRGADHCRSFPLAETTWKAKEAEKFFGTPKAADRFSYEGKPEMVKWYEEVCAVGDSLELCRIAQVGLNMPLDLLAEIVEAVTGWNLTEHDLLKVGERIVQTERIFNLRNGLRPIDDCLPERFLKETVPNGPCKGHRYDLSEILDKYYQLRGWDKISGWPKAKTLERLGINLTNSKNI